MDIHKRAVVMHTVAEIFRGTDADAVFDICMTILALNDVINGCPNHTIENGRQKLLSEIYYASGTAKVLMQRYDRIPTMTEMIDAWYTDTEFKYRTRFHEGLN